MTAERIPSIDIGDDPLLMKRMIHALAIDGLLDGPERRAAATACEGCADREACHRWLDVALLSGADHAPDFCANKDTFEALASEVPNGL